MSCELKSFAKLDLSKVQALFGLLSEPKWLSTVSLSISPTGESIAVAHGCRMILMESKFSYEKHESTFEIAWSTELENPNELITSVLCVPLIGQMSGSHSTTDWTCLVVGTQSGHVHFYTDTRFLLLTQQWHTEPIVSIKAQSGKLVKNEEVHVFSDSSVCIVEGHNLFPVLRTLRMQHIKSAPLTQVEMIPCRKWAFGSTKGQQINDAVVVGPQKTSTFDHLLTASLEGGFYARYRAAPPQNSLVVGAGMKPYVGFHYAKEGFSTPAFTDIARVASSLIKSALPSWLTGTKSSSSQEPPTPTIPVEPMVCRFGLCDIMRNGESIWLSQKNQLAVVADNLGRVVLVDCKTAVALRVWKGYREAQCCFVDVKEKLQKNMDKASRKCAQFLVIYAPRRQVLDVFALQRGPKVASFSVPRHAILHSFTHHFMGVQNVSKLKSFNAPCLFIDPVDHQIRELTIPFHCANISDANSKTAKDLHLYKRMKLCMRNLEAENETEASNEIQALCQDIQTIEMLSQAIDLLAGNKKMTPGILQKALETILEKLSSMEDDMAGPLQVKCFNLMRLLNFYLLMTGAKSCEFEEIPEENLLIEENLNISRQELETVQKLIDLATLAASRGDSERPKVSFGAQTKPLNSFPEYLEAFFVGDVEQIVLKTDKVGAFGTVGSIIFDPYLEGRNPSKLSVFMRKCGIDCEDVLRLFLHCWANKVFSYTSSEALINDMDRFHRVLRQICTYADDKVAYEYDSLCPWWQNVREFLLDSSCALRGLLAAFVCRNIALKYEGAIDAANEEEATFEQVSQEACQWTILITKLDDIAVLGAILKNQVMSDDCFLPPLPYSSPEVSLKQVVNGGKGIVTELVAKWVASTGMNPAKLVESEPKTPATPEKTVKDEEKDESKEEGKEMFCFRILKDHFPFSLQSKALLCQLAWDYMSHWSRNLNDLHLMQAGLDCLRAFRPADWAIKHGICVMVWNAHLKITLKVTKTLMDKNGRLPKERICLQEIGISDSLVPQLLEYTLSFMKEFIESASQVEKLEVRFEDILIDDESRIPLIILALDQGIANTKLLQLHAELVRVLHLIAFFNVKLSKPVERLFSSMENLSFFADIKKNLGYEIPEPDLLLTKERTAFCCKIASETVSLIREDQREIYLEEHLKWMDLVQALVEIWALNPTEIRQHQVIQLYYHGWDSYAEDILQQEKDIKDIGAELLVVAGLRLNLISKHNHKVLGQVASAGPLLMDYLEELGDSDNLHLQTENTLDKIMTLSARSFQYLASSNSRELRVAGLLLDAVATIKEMSQQ